MSGSGRVEIYLSRRAERDLEDISDADAKRICQDLKRLAVGELPNEVKIIPSLPGRPWQADSGKFRILFVKGRNVLNVISIFSRKDQIRVFRSLR